MEAKIPVVEHFHSLQGEGAHVGRSAFFIRLASCAVGCPWCDTKVSWSIDNHPQESCNSLAIEAEKAITAGAAFIVITGGEPLHHNLDPLCHTLRNTIQQKIDIHLETSGVNKLSGSPNWITLSPKRHSPPRTDLLAACQELKIVIHDEYDLYFAEAIAKQANHAKYNQPNHKNLEIKRSETPLLFLQPGWQSKKGHQLTIEYVKQNPEWRISMQTHKWLGLL